MGRELSASSKAIIASAGLCRITVDSYRSNFRTTYAVYDKRLTTYSKTPEWNGRLVRFVAGLPPKSGVDARNWNWPRFSAVGPSRDKSEVQPRSQLHLPIVEYVGNLTERRTRHVGTDTAKLVPVKDIQEFGAKLKPDFLGDAGVLL